MVVANPNNPTGTAAPREDLIRIIRAAEQAAVVIDEAYFEFYGQSLLGDLRQFPNLFITRTFSKAYGLAGLRLGVVAGAQRQIALLRKVNSPFNINSVALSCLPEALQDSAVVRDYVEQVKLGREQIYQLCDELKVRYWRSQGNFVLVEVGAQSAEFVAAMRRREIAISDRTVDNGCRGCVRITVAACEQMPQLLDAFAASFRTVAKSPEADHP